MSAALSAFAELYPLYVGSIVFGFGACIGSFLNVVVHRLPRGESLVRPRSRCPRCGEPIAAWDNVPIVSWLLLRGRCRRCATSISPRYPIVELVTATLFVAVLLLHLRGGFDARLPIDWLLVSALVAVSLIDAEHQIIPNEITYPGMVGGLVLSFFAAPPAPVDALLGCVLPAGAMWAIAALYERFRGQLGLGMGDVKLVAMLGAFLGLEAALEIVVIGSLLGLGWGVFGILFRGAGRSTRIPFGPALAAAGVLQLFTPGLLQAVLAGVTPA